MIRITSTQNSAQAKSYFSNELSKGDYYLKGEQVIGTWGGKAAEMLNLSGDITKEAFYSLCDNKHPTADKSLTTKTFENRKIFNDCTFSAPKSISILYGITQSPKILDAFHKAVKETLEEMESGMQVRVRTKGRDENRTSGNMVYGLFTHFAARPVDGISDPLLHVHATVFNASYDSVESKWKATQFHQIKTDCPYYQAAFNNRLACNMKALGFGIEVKGKGRFEIAGIPKDLIDKFSRRTQYIDKKAKELGITSAKAKSELGAKTRKAKLKEESFSDLQKGWFNRLTGEEKQALNQLGKFSHCKNDTDIQKSFEFGIEHSFERKSVMPEKRFLENVLKHGVGALSVAEVKSYTHQNLLYADTENARLVSTKEVLLEEQKLFEIARNGKGTCSPLNENQPFKKEGTHLNIQQQKAVDYLLQSNDQFLVLSGGAGVGKSTLLSEVAKGIQDNSKSVLALAPSTGAKEVLEKDGFAAAQTLQKFLLDKTLQESVKGQVVLLDEAGLVGTKPMKQLFELAKENDFRVILSGDQFQHQSVEHGDAFRLLIDQKILPSFRVQEVVRQKGDYKKAMECLSENKLSAGFDLLDKIGWVKEVKPEHIYDSVANEYVQLTKNPNESVLVVAPTHKEASEITEKIRSKLKEAGRLNENFSNSFATANALNLTKALKREPNAYEKGLEVIFHKAEKGFSKGVAYEIEECSSKGIILKMGDKKFKPLPLHLADSFSLFQPLKTAVCVHDRIKIQANHTTEDGHRMINGAEYTVKDFDNQGNMILNNGWTLDKSFKQWSLGYVGTSQGSQGKTVNHVLVLQDPNGNGVISKEGFYVAASRARKQATIFTTDKAELRNQMQRSSSRLSATETMKTEKNQASKARNRLSLMQFINRIKKGFGRGAAKVADFGQRRADSTQLTFLKSSLKQSIQKPMHVFSLKDRRVKEYGSFEISHN